MFCKPSDVSEKSTVSSAYIISTSRVCCVEHDCVTGAPLKEQDIGEDVDSL
jgi:hypothetical protein